MSFARTTFLTRHLRIRKNMISGHANIAGVVGGGRAVYCWPRDNPSDTRENFPPEWTNERDSQVTVQGRRAGPWGARAVS